MSEERKFELVSQFKPTGDQPEAIAKLVEGLPAADVAQRLRGTKCGWKQTSCPDQLARALEEALEEEQHA